jgi:geranylgeranyl pyrophosphate synthase
MSLDKLIEPVEYYKSLKGKNIRSLLIQYLGTFYSINSDIIKNVDILLNDMHNASLVIDDIQDNSLLRRGEQCAHIKYGIPLSINAGYLSIFKNLLNVSNENLSPFIEMLYQAHIGQGMDIYYTQHKIIPSEDDFLLMIEYKTGLLFKSMVTMLIYKTNHTMLIKRKQELYYFFTLFSYYFQIRDDYINLTDPSYWKEKGFCQDFDEEKISYIVMYYINHQLPNHENLLYMIQSSKHSNQLKLELLQLFHSNKIFTIIYDKLSILKQQLLQILNVEFILNQLPIHPFQIEHAVSYLQSL